MLRVDHGEYQGLAGVSDCPPATLSLYHRCVFSSKNSDVPDMCFLDWADITKIHPFGSWKVWWEGGHWIAMPKYQSVFFPLSRCDHPGSCRSHTLSEETSSPAFCSKQHRWTLDNNSQDWCILPLCAILSPDSVSVTSSQGRLGGHPWANAIFLEGREKVKVGLKLGRFPGFAAAWFFFRLKFPSLRV